MNKQVLFTIAIFLVAVFKISAQVQIDHPMQFTGTGANAGINGIKMVANGQDAVNDSSVQRDILKYAVATGLGTSAGPYVVTLNPALLAAYTTGMVIYFKAPAACLAGPVYINVNGLGSQVIKENGSLDLSAGDIALNQLVAVQYDGTNFEMQSQSGKPPSLPGLFTHYIGELYGGGIVIAVWDSLGYERGLIASTADVGTAVAWSNYTTGIGASAQDVAYGAANTAAAITAGSTSGAISLCHAYTGGGFTDWYLPSIMELQIFLYNEMIVNKVLGDANNPAVTQTSSDYYWSSTESSTTTTSAWRAGGGGGAIIIAKTTTTMNVRAVRRY